MAVSFNPPPLSPRYSRATTCLSLIQWYRPGLKSPCSQWWCLPSSKFWDQSLPKGVPRPLRLVLEGLIPLHLANARIPPYHGALCRLLDLMHCSFNPAPPRHGLTPPWAQPVEPSCHASLASASDVPLPPTHRRGYPICWVRQLLSIFRCCCRNKDDLNLNWACFEESKAPEHP